MRISGYHTSITSLLILIAEACNSPLAVIPFEETRDIIFIKAQVNGIDSLDFIFDTGQYTATIDSCLFDSLHIPAIDTITVNCVSSVKRSFLTRCSYKIGPVVMDTLITYVTPFHKYRKAFRRNVDGIIGYDLIKNHILHLNYEDKVIEVYDTSVRKSWPGTLLALVDTIAPAIIGELTLLNGKRLRGSYVIDCGSNTGITIHASLIDTSSLLDFITDTVVRRYTGTCGKSTLAVDGKTQSFRMGPYISDNIHISITTSRTGVLAQGKYTGLIGSLILKNYNIVLNTSKRYVYINPISKKDRR